MQVSRPGASASLLLAARALLLTAIFCPFVLPSYSQIFPHDVLTYHNNNSRTGLDPAETILTPSNVSTASFGKILNLPVDGHVDAQPLYLTSVTAGGLNRNLLIVATEADSLYAFDADTGVKVWRVSMLRAGETAADNRGCGSKAPSIGIQSTPVIFRPQTGDPIIYVESMSKDAAGNYHQRLHAVDATNGSQAGHTAVDIAASFPGTGDNSSNGRVIFDPGQYRERAALTLVGHTVYLAFGSLCDVRPYTGWIMGYSTTTLAQISTLNITPNGDEGGIWGSGAGMAADGDGNIFVADGNGYFDTTLNASGFPAEGDYGNALLKLTTAGGLAVADYFEVYNQLGENGQDLDLGSGGTVLISPKDSSGKVWQLAIAAGKDSNIYVVDRTNMGKFNTTSNKIYQQLTGVLPGGIWSMPAVYNGRVYYGPVASTILAFQIQNAKLLANPVARSQPTFVYPGTTPSISANTNQNGIVWAVENSNPAVLHAFDANLNELYNSNQAPNGRDQLGPRNLFITPTISNGKVYVGTTNSVAVFGLLTDK
jgi:hypothetical protein